MCVHVGACVSLKFGAPAPARHCSLHPLRLLSAVHGPRSSSTLGLGAHAPFKETSHDADPGVFPCVPSDPSVNAAPVTESRTVRAPGTCTPGRGGPAQRRRGPHTRVGLRVAAFGASAETCAFRCGTQGLRGDQTRHSASPSSWGWSCSKVPGGTAWGLPADTQLHVLRQTLRLPGPCSGRSLRAPTEQRLGSLAGCRSWNFGSVSHVRSAGGLPTLAVCFTGSVGCLCLGTAEKAHPLWTGIQTQLLGPKPDKPPPALGGRPRPRGTCVLVLPPGPAGC